MNTHGKAARHEKWRTLVEKYEKSGLSQAEFCKQQSLVLSQFVYYRSHIKANERNTASHPQSFVPVQITQPSSSLLEVRVILPNGFQCYFPGQLDMAYIKRWVEALLS